MHGRIRKFGPKDRLLMKFLTSLMGPHCWPAFLFYFLSNLRKNIGVYDDGDRVVLHPKEYKHKDQRIPNFDLGSKSVFFFFLDYFQDR